MGILKLVAAVLVAISLTFDYGIMACHVLAAQSISTT
jgi:hypothetical protein